MKKRNVKVTSLTNCSCLYYVRTHQNVFNNEKSEGQITLRKREEFSIQI